MGRPCWTLPGRLAPWPAGPIAVLVVALLAPPLARAAEEDLPTPGAMQSSGSRALAMGDAFRGIATSNEAIYFNLAGLAAGEKYEIDAAYAFDPATELSRFQASIADSRTSRVAAGIAYQRLTGQGAEGRVDGHIGSFGLGYPFSDVGAFGLGLKYLAFDAPDDTNAVTGDLGLLIRAGEYVKFGAAMYNVIDVGSREAPLAAGAGVGLGTDASWHLAVDGAFDLSRSESTPVTLHAGGEYLIGGSVPVRAGFKRLDAEDRNYVSAGLGYVVTEFGIDGAYVQNVRESELRDRIFSFTLKLFL